MKNLMLKVSNNDIEFGKAGALVTLYVGSFLATNVLLLNVLAGSVLGYGQQERVLYRKIVFC